MTTPKPMTLKQINEDSTVVDTKYIVFKRRDWEQFLKDWSPDEMVSEINEMALRDATVIRGQDLFAANALDVYAGSIGIALMVMALGHERDGLMKVADYFHERAQEARMIGYKLPDNGGE